MSPSELTPDAVFALARYGAESVSAVAAMAGLVPESLMRSRDNYGNTPLHVAAQHATVADILRLCPLAPDALTQQNVWGHTPLHVAACHGHLDAFFASGLVRPEHLSIQDQCGYTPVRQAAYHGHIEQIEKAGALRPEHLCAVDLNGVSVLELLVGLSGLHLVSAHALRAVLDYQHTPPAYLDLIRQAMANRRI